MCAVTKAKSGLVTFFDPQNSLDYSVEAGCLWRRLRWLKSLVSTVFHSQQNMRPPCTSWTTLPTMQLPSVCSSFSVCWAPPEVTNGFMQHVSCCSVLLSPFECVYKSLFFYVSRRSDKQALHSYVRSDHIHVHTRPDTEICVSALWVLIRSSLCNTLVSLSVCLALL